MYDVIMITHAVYTVFARIDAAVIIVFRSGKMRRLFEGSYHSRMRSHVLLAVTLIYVLTALCVGTMSTRQDFVFVGDSDFHVLHELSPLSVVRTVSYNVQLSSPHPGDIMNVINKVQRLFEGDYYFASLLVRCGVNSRLATKCGAASVQANTRN